MAKFACDRWSRIRSSGHAAAGDPYPLHERNQLLRNLADGRFVETDSAPFALSEVSRGSAVGDVDNDGDTDVLITNNSGPARLLINQVGNRNHWLGLRLTDPSGRSDVLGTRVELRREDGSTLWRSVRAHAGYCSSNDPRVLVGLGGDREVPVVRAHWPDGVVEEWRDLAVDGYVLLRRGSGDEVR